MHRILHHRIRHRISGFTLLELILFVSLSGILLGALAVFLGIILNSRVKQHSIVEVEEQGMRAMQVIESIIHNASSVTTPMIATTSSSLAIEGASSKRIEISNERLWYTDGANSPLSLTTADTIVSNIQFQNLSRAQTPGIIRIQFTLSRRNPEGRNEYAYQQTFYASATLH